LIQRLRPRIGWRQAVLAFAVAFCPAITATDSRLDLPATGFFWAGFLGLLLGLRIGRTTDVAEQVAANQAGDRSRLPRQGMSYAFSVAFGLAIVLGFAALLVVAIAAALPPFGLIAQDIAAFVTWALAALRRTAGINDLPPGRTWEFLAASLPRFWHDLTIAPNDGQRGARLLVAVGGVLSTWIGAVVLGWALATRRSVFGWGLPLLVAIALTATLGGGTGAMLPISLALLLLLAIVAGFGRRELDWSHTGTDYSDELGNDVLAWGGLIVVVLLVLALILPTSLSNPLADLLWRDVELPSGIAELEKNIPRPQPPPAKADIGLSRLPALQLGLSLERQPREQVSLRVRLDAPLKPSPWPRYWRARVFNLYNGREWTTDARIGPFDSSPPVAGAIPNSILQEIEDLRPDRSIMIALPDVIDVSIGAQAERLPDGALAALTEEARAERYRVLSRPQELAALPQPDGPPPDLSGYLRLPRNYPPRVGDLARVVAGTATNPYEQALALENYLRGLPYAYQVQELPGGGDAVEQFLFDMRQGYCTYYASAMAVMARSLGIPARVAVGYATGEYDQASGLYIVREADAHAWPELYINGRWSPFEPTPVRPLPARGGATEAPVPEVVPAPAEQPENSRGPLIWAAILALVALLTFAGLRVGRPRAPRSLALEVQKRLERTGTRAGVAWPAGATLHEYGELLEPHAGGETNALHDVLDLVGQARYSGQPLRSEEEGRLRAAAARIWARLRR
jgi:transglutaminase-like putative cysteine protease